MERTRFALAHPAWPTGWLVAAALAVAATGARAVPFVYRYTFDEPMSWSGDAVPWGLGEAQSWGIAEGGKAGKCLRISAAVSKQPFSYEVRTLQFNHRRDTTVTVEFDIKASSAPPGCSLVIRHFDGYCTAEPFVTVADERFKPFPAPLWDSREADLGDAWTHATLDTGPLKNTVVTLAFIVQQPPPKEGEQPTTEYVEFLLDTLEVKVTPLDALMDPGFDWHGHRGGTTTEFRYTTNAADSDWCDYADQEDVRYWNGGTIHYTLFQFRDASTRTGNTAPHNLMHETASVDLGGFSVIGLHRPGAGKSSAVSWGVRQTVAYSALGVGPEEPARVRVTMKMTNDEWRQLDFSRVQLGVDPEGGVITGRATWTDESLTVLTKGGWDLAQLEFDRPRGARAFTIYFRHRDGVPGGPEFTPPFPEPETRGSPYGCAAYADWVMAEVVR